MKNLLIVGDGGQGKVVLDCALSMGCFDRIAFLVNHSEGQRIPGYEYYLEDENMLLSLLPEFQHIIVALGNNKVRVEKTDYFERLGFTPAVLIHPSATVSPLSSVGKGSVVFAHAVINPFAQIGRACIVNTAVIVEHDCILEEGVHLSPNTSMGGETIIGRESWICVGCSIANAIKIGRNVTVGAGAAVVSDIEDNVMAAGVPAVIKKHKKQT